jgi:hypothetical protein
MQVRVRFPQTAILTTYTHNSASSRSCSSNLLATRSAPPTSYDHILKTQHEGSSNDLSTHLADQKVQCCGFKLNSTTQHLASLPQHWQRTRLAEYWIDNGNGDLEAIKRLCLRFLGALFAPVHVPCRRSLLGLRVNAAIVMTFPIRCRFDIQRKKEPYSSPLDTIR